MNDVTALGPPPHLTWRAFVQKVEACMAEHGMNPDTPISWIDWHATAFGSFTPSVYVNDLVVDGVVVMGIGED